jgi:hypothetical protein
MKPKNECNHGKRKAKLKVTFLKSFLNEYPSDEKKIK